MHHDFDAWNPFWHSVCCLFTCTITYEVEHHILFYIPYIFIQQKQSASGLNKNKIECTESEICHDLYAIEGEISHLKRSEKAHIKSCTLLQIWKKSKM